MRSLTHAFTSLKLLAAGCLFIWMAGCSCSGEIFITIGEFDSNDAALRASIPKLADAIRKCPHAKVYRIVYTAPGIYGEPGMNTVYRHALLYYRRDRQKGALGYEDDVFSGFKPEPGPYEVDDAVVNAVAEKHGALEDFAQYDRKQK